jgi:chromatin segregation and condensation protein Rec8/ScpA/Scc1 (kleisin family)
MVYVVQHEDYQHHVVIGIFESSYDALVCATVEEALTSISCRVFEMNVQPKTTDADDKHDIQTRIPEYELPEDIRAQIQQKRQDDRDLVAQGQAIRAAQVLESVKAFRELDKTKIYDDFAELVSSSNDLKHQLVNHVISIEEYRARVELVTKKANELMAHVSRVWKERNGAFSFTHMDEHVRTLMNGCGCSSIGLKSNMPQIVWI